MWYLSPRRRAQGSPKPYIGEERVQERQAELSEVNVTEGWGNLVPVEPEPSGSGLTPPTPSIHRVQGYFYKASGKLIEGIVPGPYPTHSIRTHQTKPWGN